MAIDFFEKELTKVQHRFNSILGNLMVCDLTLRQKLILAICWMGVLKRKIHQAPDKDLVREEIQKFIKYRNLVNETFNNIEEELEQRRAYENSSNKTAGYGTIDAAR